METNFLLDKEEKKDTHIGIASPLCFLVFLSSQLSPVAVLVLLLFLYVLLLGGQ